MAHRTLWLTGEQIRAARALARLEQHDLARRAGVSLETVKRLERVRGSVDATVRTIGALVRALDEVGVAFDSFPDGSLGVRQKPSKDASQGAPTATAPAAAARPTGPARLHRLIYFSAARPAGRGMMRQTLDSIARDARPRNAALGITGALLAREGRYLQLLEGERDAVRHLYGAIALDPRHHNLTIVDERPVHSRHFSDWTLCCGLFTGDDLVQDELQGLRPEALTPIAAFGLLATMSDLQRMEPRCRRGEPGGCSLQRES